MPIWIYGSGLILALGFGLTTIMRTSRMERFAALVATSLLVGLCLVQISTSYQATKHGGQKTEETGVNTVDRVDKTRIRVRENVPTRHEEKKL